MKDRGKTVGNIPNQAVVINIADEGDSIRVLWNGQEGLVERANVQAASAAKGMRKCKWIYGVEDEGLESAESERPAAAGIQFA